MTFDTDKIKAGLQDFAERKLDSHYYRVSGDENGLSLIFRRINSHLSYDGKITMEPATEKCFYRVSFLVDHRLSDELIGQMEKKWTIDTHEVFCITQKESVRNSPRGYVVNTQIVRNLDGNSITCDQHSQTFDELLTRSYEIYNLGCETVTNPPDSRSGDYEAAVKDVISDLGVKAEYKYHEYGINPHYDFWWYSDRKFSISPIHYRIYVGEVCRIEAEAPTAFYTETPEEAVKLCKKVGDVKQSHAKGRTPYWDCDIYPEDNRTCRIVFYVTLVTNISRDQIRDAIEFLEDVVNRYIPRLERAE